MAKLVTLTIDGIEVQVPEGTLVVDAAKKAGVDIPVFCYHPKMEPVGMCRMCLVEIGRPVIDRTTGEQAKEADGSPKVQFTSKLETSCTTPVSQGMVVLDKSDNVRAGREDIIEFLLTSHPLDCPICDKGGECPLQNLTMGFGPGESRFLYDEKKHLAKHHPLGELIMLDRERCIQCGRCVRFQDLIVEDPVIGFSQRGRALEIVTFSEPGFNSYWSGNTTDICPVGALTTMDFRFRARPWELRYSASICSQCAVGCNLTLNLRREAVSGGNWVVKRVMPRQNEAVNEIWICDKGRFGHNFAAQNPERLKEPLVRKGGELVPASWEEALDLVTERLRDKGQGLLTLAGGRLSNEDLYNLKKLTRTLGGKTALYTTMGGGELTTQIGFLPGTNLGHLGKGKDDEKPDAILVVGCDLEEEAPVWWLRVKAAAERGAQLIVLNPRTTKLDRKANYKLRYPYGSAAAAVLAMVNALSPKRPELPGSVQDLARSSELREAAKAFAEAENAVAIYGSEGMSLAETSALAQACANLLLTTGHINRPNNGLLGAWPHANDQGAWELGWRASDDLKSSLLEAEALYIVAADPVSDDATFQSAFGGQKFAIVQDIFLSQTARLADVVLPAKSITEREGTFTSGERRVQRYYPALQSTTALPPKTEAPGTRQAEVLTRTSPMLEGPQADFVIPVLIAESLGFDGLTGTSAAVVFSKIGTDVPVFKGLTYQKMAEVSEQWPIIGRSDLYYGGTSYENSQGLGVQLEQAQADAGGSLLGWPQASEFKLPKLGLTAFPITRLYDQGATLKPSKLLLNRIGEPYVVLNSTDASRLKVDEGSMVRISFNTSDQSMVVQARLSEELPERIVLVPRSFGIPIDGPASVDIKLAN
jgi:NADH-quinone oxidoreductase subunit G